MHMTARKMKSFRLSPQTLALLETLAAHLTAKDGVRRVSVTEVIERAVHALARKEGVRPG